jgi:hypothetical protein
MRKTHSWKFPLLLQMPEESPKMAKTIQTNPQEKITPPEKSGGAFFNYRRIGGIGFLTKPQLKCDEQAHFCKDIVLQCQLASYSIYSKSF